LGKLILSLVSGAALAVTMAMALLAGAAHAQQSYASSEPGTIQQLAAESFMQAAGIQMLRVSYKGSSQAVVKLVVRLK
jgi:tripartite-type tricarboxylate transporter receptor subunit TctC